jgi:hypothetical protein
VSNLPYVTGIIVLLSYPFTIRAEPTVGLQLSCVGPIIIQI